MTKLEIGAWNKLPHYAVVGDSVNFYVWILEEGKYQYQDGQGESGWIKGQEAFAAYNKLKQLIKKDVDEFIKMVKKLHKQYPRRTK